MTDKKLQARHYRLSNQCCPTFSLIRSLIARPKGKDNAQQILHALKDISFSVKKAETFGILGPNASGKTTLLKLIAGILKPTQGEIKVNGNRIVFLQVGLGFQDELTGFCTAILS